ncbi:hypothetical protein ACPPVQ_07030 [Diaminobutyricibacter sp. McL0618]|uniref:hypothetical protein n=1 Tax=Leifsonia sp. McL0618 TaxID=3415677 RepID=UPI003CE7397A
MRITTTVNKVIYILVGEVVVLALNSIVIYNVVPPVVDLIAVFVLNFVYVFIGVRTFRGPGEDVAAPRAWWRATARPFAGFIIGGIASVLALISLLGALAAPPEQSGTAAVVCVGWALLAAYYLSSSFRLRALDQPE